MVKVNFSVQLNTRYKDFMLLDDKEFEGMGHDELVARAKQSVHDKQGHNIRDLSILQLDHTEIYKDHFANRESGVVDKDRISSGIRGVVDHFRGYLGDRIL